MKALVLFVAAALALLGAEPIWNAHPREMFRAALVLAVFGLYACVRVYRSAR